MSIRYLLWIVICLLAAVICWIIYTDYHEESFTVKDGSGYTIGFSVSIWRLSAIAIALAIIN